MTNKRIVLKDSDEGNNFTKALTELKNGDVLSWQGINAM